MAFTRSPKVRVTFLGAWMFAAVVLAVVALQSGADAVGTDSLYYSATISTKHNAQAVGANPHLVTARVAGVAGPLDSLRTEPAGPSANGQLQIDTADTSTWKPVKKINASTWTIQSKATNVASAGVYVNGSYLPLRSGATITVKFTGVSRSGIYVKVTGQASLPGGTLISVEAEANDSNSMLLNSPTPTQTATNTSTNTPTNTAIAPTNTSTNTPTNTAVAPTNTSTNTPTNTSVPPTNTATNTPIGTITSARLAPR